MPRSQHPVAGALSALAAFGLYSGYDMAIKALGGALSPVQILFCAGIATFPLVMLRLMLSRETLSLWPIVPRWTAIRMGVVVLNGVLGAYAFAILPLAEAYAIFFLMPLMIALLAVPLLKEKIDPTRGLAVIAGLAGVVVALGPGANGGLGVGHLAAFVAASLGALNYVGLRKTGGVENWAVLMLWPMVAQLAAVTVALPFVWQPMSGTDLALTGLMAAMGFVGALFVIAAYRMAPAIVVAPMQYSQIFWAALMGALVFDETIPGRTWIGIAIIVGSGLVILLRAEGPHPAPRADAA